MRDFGVGYAPGDVTELLRHLVELGYSDEELLGAGIATRSDREHLHVLFHARVMFPLRAADGQTLGFAGLATHLGPSWPLWITSPQTRLFQPDSTMFGIDRAIAAILGARRALIRRDCVEVMRLHQDGRGEAVGVIQRPITRAHLAVLGRSLGVPAGDLSVVRNRGLDAVLVQPAGERVEPEAFGPQERPHGSGPIAATIRSNSQGGPEVSDVYAEEDEGVEPQAARSIVYVAGILVGVGLPIGTLLLVAPDTGGQDGATPALNVMIATVAAAYLVLTVIVSRVSAQHRTRSPGRRMRLPWTRGSGEVQPSGWTYNRLEETLIGAALVSALICIVLWMTIGGFLG